LVDATTVDAIKYPQAATRGIDLAHSKRQTWDSPVPEFVTYKISRVHNKLNSQTARILRDISDITVVRWRIVAMLGTVERATMSDLATMSNFDKGLLSRNLAAMADLGIITSETDPHDRRMHHIELTEAGRQLYALVLPKLVARNEALISDVSEADLAAFNRVLTAIDGAAGR